MVEVNGDATGYWALIKKRGLFTHINQVQQTLTGLVSSGQSSDVYLVIHI